MNKCEKLTGYILSEQYLSGYLQLSSESGGVLPSGTRVITTPGIYDVYNYAKADVRIQKPTGNYNITSNGKYHIPEYEYVTVNVANIDTSDGTATPDKMDRGTIAYSKGARVVGNVDAYEENDVWHMPKPRLGETTGSIVLTTLVARSANLKEKSKTRLEVNKSEFGDATASDVKQGKTFTAADGLKKSGTYVPSGGSGIDTSDGTATPDTIDKNVVAYSKGQRIVGTSTVYHGMTPSTSNVSLSADSTNVSMKYSIVVNSNFKVGANIVLKKPVTDFGDATEADVVQGKTFTSAAGLKKTGTYVPSGGIDTSDGTATPETMDAGVVAYSKGKRVVGTAKVYDTQEYSNGYVFDNGAIDNGLSSLSGTFVAKADVTEPMNLKPGLSVLTPIAYSDFGDATADDVKQGKTFTSAAGLKVTGAYVPSGGGGDPMKASATVATTATATGDTLLLSGNSYLAAHKDDPKLVVTIICATALTTGVTYATASNSAISGSNKFVTIHTGGIAGSAAMQSTGALNTAETGNFGRLYLNASGDLYFHSYVGGSSWQKTSVAIQAGTYTVFYGLLN